MFIFTFFNVQIYEHLIKLPLDMYVSIHDLSHLTLFHFCRNVLSSILLWHDHYSLSVMFLSHVQVCFLAYPWSRCIAYNVFAIVICIIQNYMIAATIHVTFKFTWLPQQCMSVTFKFTWLPQQCMSHSNLHDCRNNAWVVLFTSIRTNTATSCVVLFIVYAACSIRWLIAYESRYRDHTYR